MSLFRKVVIDQTATPFEEFLYDSTKAVKGFFYTVFFEPLHRIKKGFSFMRVLWKFYDFDRSSILKALQYSIQRHREHVQDCNMQYKGWEKQAHKMRVCELLLQRLIDDEYFLYHYDKMQAKYNPDGEDFFENLNKPKPASYKRDLTQAANYGTMMRNQDLDLVFKIIRRNIDKWWC